MVRALELKSLRTRFLIACSRSLIGALGGQLGAQRSA